MVTKEGLSSFKKSKIVTGVVNYGYFTVRLTVRGGGSVPLALAKLLSYHQIKDKSPLTPVKSKKNISVKAAKGGCPKKY